MSEPLIPMRPLRLVHRWVGLVLAAVLALVGASGVLLLAKRPYQRARWPRLAAPVAHVDPVAYAEIVEGLGARHPERTLTRLKFPQPGANAFQLWFADEGEALVDAATGATIAEWRSTSDPMAFAFDLHAHLLGGDRGELANGLAALLAVCLALTGGLLWWPRRAGVFRLRHAWPGTIRAGALLRSHAAVGALVGWLVVAFAATGAGLVFDARLAPLASALFDDQAPQRPGAIVQAHAAPRAPWRDILQAVERALPGGTLVYASPGSGDNAVFTFRKRMPGEWHPNGRSYVLVDPYTASVVQVIDARRQGRGTRAMFAIYPIHAATIGGRAMVGVAACAGLALTWLAVSGLWSFVAVRPPGRTGMPPASRPRAHSRHRG